MSAFGSVYNKEYNSLRNYVERSINPTHTLHTAHPRAWYFQARGADDKLKFETESVSGLLT